MVPRGPNTVFVCRFADTSPHHAPKEEEEGRRLYSDRCCCRCCCRGDIQANNKAYDYDIQANSKAYDIHTNNIQANNKAYHIQANSKAYDIHTNNREALQTTDRQRGVVYGLSATTMDDMQRRR
jgi:hypothetical protein